MVIDELFAKKGTTLMPIDSYNNEMIDEINYEGQKFHFAKQKDLTGTSEVVADNAVDEPIISLGVSGNTTQKTYAGYNLFNQDKLPTRSDFTKSEYNGFDCFKVIPENFLHTFALPSLIPSGTEISFSFDVAHPNSKGNVYIYVVYEDTTEKSFIWYENTPSTVVDFVHITGSIVATQNVTSIKFAFFERFTYRPYYFKNFMLNIGEEKPYEPYVGGTYSPNPDYPQAIENTNSEGMIVVVHGANLYDISKVNGAANASTSTPDLAGHKQFGTVTDGVLHMSWGLYANATIWTGSHFTIKQGGKYFVSAEIFVGSDFVSTSPTWITSLKNFTKGANCGLVSTPLTERDTWTLHTATLTVPDNWVGDEVYLICQSRGSSQQYINTPMYARNVMISYGEAKPYEPYFREEITIPESVEVEGATVPLLMSKWDKLTVDRITKKVIYTEGSCKKVFTGEEAWRFHTIQPEYNIPNVWYRLERVSPKGNVDASINPQNLLVGFGYSNMLQFSMEQNAPNVAEWGFRFQYRNGNRLYIITPPEAELDTIDKFKAFLQEKYANGTPLTIEYAINPITHDITNTELGQSLLALATRKGTNYLEVKGNLAPSKTDLSYWRQIIPNE